MDNSNNPNFPNSTPPVPGAVPTPTPTPTWPQQPVTPPTDPSSPWSPTPTATPWSPPPAPLTPAPQPFDSSQLTSTFTSTPPSAVSPLDNPWGAPAQPPVIDSSAQNNPSLTPQAPAMSSVNSQPSWMTSNPNPTEQTPTESAPTDLSQLIAGSNAAPPEPNAQTPATPETLVVSQSNTDAPSVPNLPSEGRKGIPIWLIGVGIALLIVVLGASAYFILGIGQPPKTTTSLPLVTESSNPVGTPAPIATPVPQATENTTATASGNFGQLGGTTTTQQATSAADLIRQRQQQTASNP